MSLVLSCSKIAVLSMEQSEVPPKAAADSRVGRAGGAVVAGGSRCSVATGGASARAVGRYDGWQDLRAVHDSRGPCSERGPFMARYLRGVFPNGCLRGFSDTWRAYLAKASSFWIHGARILPRTGVFPSEAIFGMHGAQNLPRIDAQERTAAESCHGKTPENA